jgi:RHS repeat-associated protein
MVAINTKYTIEPHANGGSPIMADGNVIFNDMLGSSLGTVENGTFKEISRTSFGDQLSNSSTPELSNFSNDFFTEKPSVEGLGYSFLFRNYRADVGKWQTADPLGYPDGWNNFAYCGNRFLSSVDILGLKELNVVFISDRTVFGDTLAFAASGGKFDEIIVDVSGSQDLVGQIARLTLDQSWVSLECRSSRIN